LTHTDEIAAGNVDAGAPARVYGIRIDVAMRGARMHYAIPSLLARAGLLGTFYTDAYSGNKPWVRGALKRIDGLLRASFIRAYLGREAADIEPSRVVSFDLLGMKCILARRRLSSRSQIFRMHARYNAKFCQEVAKLGFSGASAVYALNGAALEIFREAKTCTVCILEQTIAPARIEDRLLAEEAQRWPGSQAGTADFVLNPLAAREEAEWRLADCIVCGSEFVAAGLESIGVERAKCWVVPYGVDTSTFRPREDRGSGRGLNVLFIGAVGLRKGVPYLLEALRIVDNARLRCRLVGHIEVNRHWLAEHQGSAEVMGPVPRSDVMSMYDWADVFVLPSICEGSATVTYEALACGLPVITTPNSGSVVRDGKDGFVVPIRDPDAIAARLRQLLENCQLRRTISANARQRSQEFSLQSYAARVISLVNSLIGVKESGNTTPTATGER
jgi:glycosyltransferase involved in cell wall biosynthesis